MGKPTPAGVKASVWLSGRSQRPGTDGEIVGRAAPIAVSVGRENVTVMGSPGAISPQGAGVTSACTFFRARNQCTCSGGGSRSHVRATAHTVTLPACGPPGARRSDKHGRASVGEAERLRCTDAADLDEPHRLVERDRHGGSAANFQPAAAEPGLRSEHRERAVLRVPDEPAGPQGAPHGQLDSERLSCWNRRRRPDLAVDEARRDDVPCGVAHNDVGDVPRIPGLARSSECVGIVLQTRARPRQQSGCNRAATDEQHQSGRPHKRAAAPAPARPPAGRSDCHPLLLARICGA